MDAHKIETILTRDGQLSLEQLPFAAGDEVEIIVLRKRRRYPQAEMERYPLRGTPVRYDDPFGGVAVDDWEAGR